MTATKTIARIGVQALAAAGILIGTAPKAWAAPVTINFDSIATPNCGNVVPDTIPGGFGGFTWDSSFGVECDPDYKGASGSDNSYGAPSSANAVYNEFGNTPLLISRGSPFQFDGAMFSGWTISDLVDLAGGTTAQSVTVNGYLGGTGGTLVGTQTLTLAGADASAALGYLALAGIVGAIDTLQISTPANTWLMDDLQYEVIVPAGPSVPEPASVVLLGSGIAGLLALRRRRASSAARRD